jgi:hypothetical protein
MFIGVAGVGTILGSLLYTNTLILEATNEDATSTLILIAIISSR